MRSANPSLGAKFLYWEVPTERPGTHLSLKDGLAAALDNHSPNLTAALKDAHHGDLVLGSGASDAALANTEVHVASLAAYEGLVSFDLRATLAAQLHQRTALHGETDAMEHKPRGRLSNTETTGKLARGYAVLAVGDDPHGGEPFLKTKGRILEYSSDLGRELPPSVSALALPFLLVGKPRHVAPSAGGAGHTIRPNLRHHVGDALVGICEVNDGFLKSSRAAHVSRIGGLS